MLRYYSPWLRRSDPPHRPSNTPPTPFHPPAPPRPWLWHLLGSGKPLPLLDAKESRPDPSGSWAPDEGQTTPCHFTPPCLFGIFWSAISLALCWMQNRGVRFLELVISWQKMNGITDRQDMSEIQKVKVCQKQFLNISHMHYCPPHCIVGELSYVLILGGGWEKTYCICSEEIMKE